MKIKKLSIIIPVYNEERTIQVLLRNIYTLTLTQNIEKEIIIVNDCSLDQSKKEIEQFVNKHKDLVVLISLDHQINLGKGACIRTGIKEATGEYIIIQDADLELNPNEINLLLEPVLNDEADIVYGSRFLNQPKKLKNESFLNRMANKGLTKINNLISGVSLTDMQTCYKLFPTKVAKQLVLKENRFAFDPEVTVKLAKIKHLRWKEVPITYLPRKHSEGKKIGWNDGFRALYSIIKYRFNE